MERQKIARTELLRILVDETGRIFGRDAIFLRRKIGIKWRAGEPNWDANCEVAGTVVSRAFAIAVSRAQALYELDERDPSRVEIVKVFARKRMNVLEWTKIQDQIRQLQTTLGATQDLMMFSAETDDPIRQDIYIGLPDIRLFAAFPGFRPVDRNSLPNFLATLVAREDGFEQRYPDIYPKRLRRL